MCHSVLIITCSNFKKVWGNEKIWNLNLLVSNLWPFNKLSQSDTLVTKGNGGFYLSHSTGHHVTDKLTGPEVSLSPHPYSKYFGWGETIWSSYVSTKQRAVIVTCGGHGNASIWLIHSILNSLYNTHCLYPPTQMFFWLVIQSFPNKFSWERNEWQSPKNVNVAWERRLSFPHIFCFSHALCPLTHAGYSLNVKKIILLPFESQKARKDSGLYIWFSPFCHYHVVFIFSFWSFFYWVLAIQQ